MIESSKYKRENYPRKCFWTPKRETRVKFNPGLSADQPLSNWAQAYKPEPKTDDFSVSDTGSSEEKSQCNYQQESSLWPSDY